ncbi:hypothetical protein BTW00_04905 [Psychrobacter sp. C 20.9]|uniref:hypothetical protein n=1 Tax=Psychrobacter sp. C 20.9 TaxID=1926477 RepID=UPI000946929C|nr:hypothetical protein [Psychrobacter sp. C 20.9]OLF36934.1 hypothetical protein BTW00_04905 [Psychrobacter sp. C 20.9]
MKKIIVSSILAATACLSMVSQANAAPDYSKSHAAQVQHQKHGNKADSKADSKHKVVKNKAKVSQQKAKIVAAKHKAQEKHQDKYQGKYKNDKQSKNDYRHRS